MNLEVRKPNKEDYNMCNFCSSKENLYEVRGLKRSLVICICENCVEEMSSSILHDFTNKKIISLLEELIPEDSDELEEFDMSKKHDHVYCVEWGMKKQRWIENGVHKFQIEKLKANGTKEVN